MNVSTRVRRPLTAGLAALALAAALTACGSDAGADTAADTGSTETTAPATPEPTPPTEAPKPGSLPDFPYTDYSYVLEQRCFCANVDQKYAVTVAGGKVTSVTWATKGEGHAVGDPVPDSDYLRLTIQDIIDQGNDAKAAKVTVEWPAGQLYPTSVYVDQDKMIADEEMTWVISDVQPA